MVIFIVFSTLAGLTCVLVYFVSHISWVVNKTKWRDFKLGKHFLIRTRLGFLLGGIFAFLILPILLISILIFYTFYHLQVDPSWYFTELEIFSSAAISDGVLGLLFGSLLAVFSISIYHLPSKKPLDHIHRFLGAGLLVIFITGITPVTIEEILRGFRHGKNGISFQLEQRIDVGSSSASVNERAIYPAIQELEETRLTNGFRILYYLSHLIKADSTYFSEYIPDKKTTKQLKTGKVLKIIYESYRDNIFPFLACLHDISEKTYDIKYVNEKLIRLKLPISILYSLSRLDLDKARKSLEKTHKQVAIVLDKEDKNALSYARKIDQTLCNRQLFVIESAAKREYQSALNRSINIPPILEGVHKRPYLAMFYASLLNIDGQELAAIKVLEDFLKTLKKSSEPESAAFWYEQRIRGTLNVFYDAYIEQHQLRTPLLTRKAFLVSLEMYGDLMKNLVTVNEDNDKFFPLFKSFKIDGRVSWANELLQRPEFAHICIEDPKGKKEKKGLSFKNKIKMNAGFISTRALYARRALDDPRLESDSVFLRNVHDIVERIAHTDLSCMKNIFGIDQTLKQRAEYLLVYALYQQKMIELFRNENKEERKVWIVKKAARAVKASKLALNTLDKIADGRINVVKLSHDLNDLIKRMKKLIRTGKD